MAYSELIKNFEKVRAYMREFYVYGFKSRTEYDAKSARSYLGMSDAEYRKTLVELRKKIRIIENHLREKDYSFDYAKQPSKAMFKYRKAFLRNDGERYNAFLEAVSSGEKQLHADNLAPYEIVRSALNANRWGFHADLTVGEKAALNASWASLPDFCDNRNALAVVDTSGSMYCYDNALPAAVALSLGLYFGERNTGIFHNHFIEFSSRPQLIEIKGKTFVERLEYLCTFNEVADTNVEAVFDLILDAAVRNNVPQEELPETLYLISDMEFNTCVRNASVSNFASAKRRFAEHGYRLPQMVFWNVASRNSNQPVTKNEQGVALVSGCTPRLFSMVASGDLSPYKKQNLLNQQFTADRPNQIWVSDITYFKINDYWVYFCVILDLFSRKVVGYRVSRNASTNLVTSTFRSAFRERGDPSGLTFHSDRGKQYTSAAFTELLQHCNVKQSFSATARPHDNAVAEAFFASFKKEEAYRREYTSEQSYRKSVEQYIQFYNELRPHRTLKYKTPTAFEEAYWAGL